MTKVQQIKEWQSLVEYSPEGPRHHVLVDTGSYRAVLVGIEAGGKIPPHPSTDATYHFLDGSGWMIVDGERYPVSEGSTIVVPSKAKRGIEAETRLAFLGSHGGHGKDAGHQHVHGAPNNRRPLVMFGLMALSMLVVMVGLWQIGASPMAMMLSGFGNMGLGAWGAMLIPMLGLLGMSVMMFMMYRNMSGMSKGISVYQHTSMVSHETSSHAEEATEQTTYSIPSISCGGCKGRIEQEIGQMEGVSAVDVDVEAKQASISFTVPATEEDIVRVLAEIGYPVADDKQPGAHGRE